MIVSIGFYILKDSLCIAELSLSAQQPEILSVNEVFFKDSQSEEEKQITLSREIERIETKYKGQNIRFCYSLSQSVVSNFFVEFPFKEKFKILKTLPFEVEDKTPFQLDKVFFDARICRTINGNKSSVLVFVTPEENIKEFINFIKPLKSSVHLLSCPASALANLLEIWNVSLSQAQNLNSDGAYIYLGLESSLILLYKEGFLEHVSVLDWNCCGIIEDMAKSYKLTKEQACEEFFAKSFILTQSKGFTKEQVFFSNLIKKQIRSLVPELKLLKVSLETRYNQIFSKAMIFGPGAMIKNLSVFITEELEFPVSKLRYFAPFSNFDLQRKPLADVALGLALEGLKKSPYTGLNLLQSTKKEDILFYPRKWKKTALMFLFCFFAFVAYAFIRQIESSKILSKVNEVFLDYGSKIAYLRTNAIHVESIKKFLAREEEKQADEKIVQEQLSLKQPMDHLQQIVQKLGSAEVWNLSLQSLKITGRKIELRGLIDQSALEPFKTALQSLSEQPIQEISPALEEKEAPAITQMKKGIESGKADDSQISASSAKEESLNQNTRSFSYSFTLKEEL